MQTVVETAAYLAAANAAGLTDAEREYIVDIVADDPLVGDLMIGTGGCRKFRIAGRGKGKSGGYRVVHFYGGGSVPVFLLTMFGKNEKGNLSKDERNALAKLTAVLMQTYVRR